MWYDLSESGRQITLRTAGLELSWSCENGAPTALRRPGGASAIGHGRPAPAIDLALGTAGGWIGAGSFARYLWHRAEPCGEGVAVTVAVGLGPITVRDRYCVSGELVMRRALIENAGPDELRLCGLRLALPQARVGPAAACYFEAPGNSVRPRVPLAVAAAQRREVLPRRFFAPGLRGGSALEPAPSQGLGLLALHADGHPETLLCWYGGGAEAALPFVYGCDGDDGAVSLAHEVGLAGWLRPGVQIESGAQLIALAAAPWPAALDRFRALADSLGPSGPADPATWVADSAIYLTHAADHGGLAGLTAELPRLAGLGVGALALLPVCLAGADPHSPADLGRIDPRLGDAAALRELVECGHGLGLRVLLDLPLQGVAAEARYVAEHPEWLLRDESGRLVAGQPADVPAVSAHPGVKAPPGRHQIDWQQQGPQEHVLGWAAQAVGELGLDGLRAVAPYGPAPAWGRRADGHASQSSLAPLALLGRLRAAIRAARPDGALLCTLPGPAYAGLSDGCFDYVAHHMFIHLALGRITPAELGAHQADYRRAAGPGCARIGFVQAHDTWEVNPLADGLGGSRISRMLLAGMALCGLVPALWSGQERGDEPFVRALLELWRAEPALRHGPARFGAAAGGAPELLTVLREQGGRRLLGLINVGARRHEVTLDLAGVGGGGRPRDLLGASPLALRPSPLGEAVYATLEPFAAYCLEL